MRVSARFWSKVRVAPADACWTWHAAKTPQGYGRFGVNGVNRHAHRVAYELAVGPIPDGLHIDHLCRNPSCVNPDHLEPVPQRENCLRAMKGGRDQCVNGHPYTDANTIITKAGHRACRTCRYACGKAKRIRDAAAQGRELWPLPGDRTHCVHGHVFDDQSTWRDKLGKRHCRRCWSERRAARRAREAVS